MQPPIIVLGLTYNQVPLLQKIQALGHEAIAIGVGGGPSVAKAHADRWFPVSTMDADAVEALVREVGAVGMVTCGTSSAICTIAQVTETLGLSDKFISPQVAHNAVFKENYRRFIPGLMPGGFSHSDAVAAYEGAKALTRPVLLKPADGGGGKGITVVEGPGAAEFERAFAYAESFSRIGEVIVEEFVRGPVVGVESLVLDGVVHLLAIPDKIVSPPPRCITLGVSFPSQLPQAVQARIHAVNAATIKQMGILWGPTHIDMVITPEGEPKVIDIGPRLAGGALMARLVPAAYRYDIYAAVIRLAMGEQPEPPGEPDDKHYASRFITTAQQGILRGVRYTDADVARHQITSITQLVSDGATLDEPDNDGARLMMFTSSGDTHATVMAQLDGFSQALQIEITDDA